GSMVATVAKDDRKPVKRLECDLRPANLVRELVCTPARLFSNVPLALPPAQCPTKHVREAELADQALALREVRARLGRKTGLLAVARQLHRALEVLARLLSVADPAEHPPEDSVSTARRTGLAHSLGEPQRLFRCIYREHVVPGMHVQRSGLFVETDKLETRR